MPKLSLTNLALPCGRPILYRKKAPLDKHFFLTYAPRLSIKKTCSMIKFVYCVRRHPSLTPEAFRKYWVERHGPYVASFATALKARRYVQSHTVGDELNSIVRQLRGTTEPYDGITEIWWDSIEDLIAANSTPEGQKANQLLAQDEARFVDLSKSCVFFTEEHTVFDR